MKTVLFTISLFIGLQLVGQTNAKVTGVWQWYMNDKALKAGDLGYTQYSNYMVYHVFTNENKMYLVMATSIDGVSKTKLPNQLSATAKSGAEGYAVGGDYLISGNTVEGTIDGTPFSWDYNPTTKRLKSPNPDVKIELIYKKVF